MDKFLSNIIMFFLSKVLLKIISYVVAFVIIFNCTFSVLFPNINYDDLSRISNIQKDIFSAIFFVSNFIEKINFSVTTPTTSTNNSSNSQNSKKKANPFNYNDFIFTSFEKYNTEEINQNYNNIGIGTNASFCKFNSFMLHEFVDKFNLQFSIFFIVVLLFFKSIKKIYYAMLENINLNIEKSTFA